MTDDGPCAGASEVTDTYLRTIKSGNQHQSAVLGYQIDIRAKTFRELAPIAAREGLSVSVFINRLCEAAIEVSTAPLGVAFDG